MRFAWLTESAAKYKWFLIFFPAFLAVQLYQSSFFNWDSAVYDLQGKWFCGEKIYFEFLRPPLPGIMHCAVGAGENAPLLTIILASFLYLAALIFVFKKEKETNQKTNQLVFAAFSLLFPTILWNANFGSDLFALSFLLIALAVQTEAKGLFFGLSTLSRYNFVLYAPIFLLQVKPKKWPSFFAVFLLAWTPWLLFNFVQTGNPLFSVEDFFYLNVVQKGIAAPLTLEHAALILFFFASVLLASGLETKNLKNPFFQAGLICVLQFLFSGVKETRYLNVLVPSQALFLAKKTSEQPRPKGRRVATAPRLFSETKTKIFAALLVVGLLAISLNASFDYARAGAQKEYIIPNDEKMRECRVMSDQWIRFYDKGIVAEPLPREDDFGYFLKTGASLVIYEKNISMEKSLDYDAIIGKNYLFLRPNKCAQQPTSFVLKVWRGDWNIKK